MAKFGGSSLANAEQFNKVKNIVLEDKSRKYVVPSAPGKRCSEDYKITDLFYLCHAHVQQKIPFNDVYRLIEERYLGIVKDLELELDIEKYLKEVKENITNGASADYTASRGEYLNGLILADFLGFDFVDACELIKFDESGYYDSETTDKAIYQVLVKESREKGVVIPGFYGAMPDDEIKTFTRSGSDVSGSIIAHGVKADLYENWTDVSGFLMTDPRIVENPKPIAKITYKELRELSYMGASVLHEDAVFPVLEDGIPINIRNTNKPEDDGTLIVGENKSDSIGAITGIAGRKNFTVLAIEKTLMNSEIGFGRRVLSVLESHGVSYENTPSGIDTMSVIVDDVQIKGKLDKIIKEIKRTCNPDSLQAIPNMALIATVGRGMAQTVGVAARIFGALAKESVNIRMIDQGSSEMNIIVGVENHEFEKAIRAIYREFE
ncbi:aspartate kinase [Clostridium grantii DSM 8605]|uniref:Aspartokinase n=1 Tax=Clostridium grantii DSM 8605 TaxID=1121316 RepID=A0A1M5RLI1_9CLOT|nr:aspartate kinase [Clostridium grantii DSM 8605]